MHTRSAVTSANVLLGGVIVLAIVLGAVALLRVHPWGGPGSDPSGDADDGLTKLRKIDPALIQYRQTAEIPAAMQEVRALAVAPRSVVPDGRVYVAGDQAIHVFGPDGEKRAEIPLGGQPTCLAVGGSAHAPPGRVYVGMRDHVEVLNTEGTPETAWDGLGEKALLTSLAVAEQDVFVADAGNKVVWRYDTSGKRRGRIGQRDVRRGIPGFVIPSPYFDVAVAPDGLLRVVNPGALRIEAYTFDGDLERFWGKGAATLEGFFGCCNPAHFAIFGDGRFVTAEKGVPRVKVYGPEGEFICVVAGPEQLDVVAADVAVDARDRVLILDPKARSVRIFEHQQTSSRAE